MTAIREGKLVKEATDSYKYFKSEIADPLWEIERAWGAILVSQNDKKIINTKDEKNVKNVLGNAYTRHIIQMYHKAPKEISSDVADYIQGFIRAFSALDNSHLNSIKSIIGRK